MATTEQSVSSDAAPLGYWAREASVRRRSSWLDWAYLALAVFCAALAVAAAALVYGYFPVPWSLLGPDIALGLPHAMERLADGLGLTLFALGLAEVLWVGRKRCAAAVLAGTWVSGLTLTLLLYCAALPPLNR